jgi:PPOX class probable F420-dependent enzyme
MSPVLTVLDDDGALIISSREPTAKVRNLRKRPYAYVTVLNEGFYGNWVEVEGAVTIESLPGAMEGLIRYYRLAAGEHPDWDDYRRAMERDQRVLIRMQIERASGVLEP